MSLPVFRSIVKKKETVYPMSMKVVALLDQDR